MLKNGLKLKFFCLSILCATLLCGCNPRENPLFKKIAKDQSEKQTQLSKEVIEKSLIHKDLDYLCKQLPLDNKFQLVRMTLGKKRPYLVYYYISDLPYQYVKSVFGQHFNREGWQIGETYEGWLTDHRFEFKNDKYWVEITYFAGELSKEDGNYAISCGLL